MSIACSTQFEARMGGDTTEMNGDADCPTHTHTSTTMHSIGRVHEMKWTLSITQIKEEPFPSPLAFQFWIEFNNENEFEWICSLLLLLLPFATPTTFREHVFKENKKSVLNKMLYKLFNVGLGEMKMEAHASAQVRDFLHSHRFLRVSSSKHLVMVGNVPKCLLLFTFYRNFKNVFGKGGMDGGVGAKRSIDEEWVSDQPPNHGTNTAIVLK